MDKIEDGGMAGTDTIQVPDELLEEMGGLPPDEDKKPEAAAAEPEKTPEPDPQPEPGLAEDTLKAEGDIIVPDEEVEPQTWKPKHNPEYYKKKGKKTQAHIRDLAAKRFEAEERANEMAAELEQTRRELERVKSGGDPDEPAPDPQTEVVAELEEMIEFARDDGKTNTVRILEKQLEEAKAAKTQAPDPKAVEIAPDAQKWLDENEWYNQTDDLGRLKYPQLRSEAIHRERALLQSMDRGPELYERLNQEMAVSLEAFEIQTPRRAGSVREMEAEVDVDDDYVEPKPGLQPYRGGGAEVSDTRTRQGGGMTNQEQARMVAIFKKTKMDPNNPDHRRAYLRNLRGN